MRKKEITELVLKASNGLLSCLVDLVLWNIFYISEVSLCGSPHRVKYAETLAFRDLERFNSETIKRAITQGKTKGLIDKRLALTKEGKQRLKNALPAIQEKKKWNGNWYLVAYDIPKNKNRYRDILRNSLKRLGFGQLQASVWVSAFDFSGEVEKIVEDYKLSSHVILAITDKLGKEEARVLAEKIWGLKKLNRKYGDLLKEIRKSPKENFTFFYFEYLSILKKDPCLPQELLPDNWQGREAGLAFRKVSKKIGVV